jgi:hypothetical protein
VSEKTAAAAAKASELLAALKSGPAAGQLGRLADDVEALRRAISAFHMEAIRFRMYSVDRALTDAGADPAVRRIYDELRHALEEAGFQTRSHSAP